MLRESVPKWICMIPITFLLVLVGCSSDNENEVIDGEDVEETTTINSPMSPIDAATKEFKRSALGSINDYVVEDISEPQSKFWLISFSPIDFSLAPPGSTIVITVDKKSLKAELLSD